MGKDELDSAAKQRHCLHPCRACLVFVPPPFPMASGSRPSSEVWKEELILGLLI